MVSYSKTGKYMTRDKHSIHALFFATVFGLLLFSTPLPANVVSLHQIYAALAETLPFSYREAAVKAYGEAVVIGAHAPYAPRVSVQGSSTLETAEPVANTGVLSVSWLMFPNAEQTQIQTLAQTQSRIQMLTETSRQLSRYQEATTLYFDALTAQEALRHTDAMLAVLAKQQAWVKQQVEIGRSKPSSLTSMTLSVHRLQLQRAQYQRQKREAMVALAALTGISETVSLETLPDIQVPSLDSQSVYARPDIRLQQSRIQVLDAKLAAITWSFWPQIQGVGSLQSPADTASVGLSATWLLWDGEAREQQRRQLQAEREIEFGVLQELLRGAIGVYWTQTTQITERMSEVELAKKAVATAETQYRQYQADFETQLVTLLDVLQTLHTWHDAQLDLSRRTIALQASVALMPLTVAGKVPLL